MKRVSNTTGNAGSTPYVRKHVRRGLTFVLLWVSLLALAVSLFAQGRHTRYALILEDPPVAEKISSRKELRHAAAEDLRGRIEAAQAGLRRELQRRDIRVTGAVQTLLNAVFVRTTEDRVEELRRLPGVKGVAPLPRMRLHMDRAAGLVKGPAAWGLFGGTDEAGKGMKIGIIDTGIDHNHPAFQEPLLPPPPGYPKCVGSDCAYTNNKVIVARSYVRMVAEGFGFTADEVAATSRPDDLSPRDRVGHGTAAAMIAAGLQNTAPNAITITGMAPRAFLGNYKIFGSPGVNDYTFGDVVITALDDAFLDGMDVVSLSLGSPALYGPLDSGGTCGENPAVPCDIRADAVQRAVAKGMTVVVSAGNDGDLGTEFPTFNTVGTPGTAPDAITVGASTNSHAFYQSVRVTGGGVPSNLQRINALSGDGPRPSGTLTAPLRDVTTLGNDGKACSTLPPGSLTGMIALVERGECFFSVKVGYAQLAGAVGVVITREAGTDVPISPAGLSQTGIPAMMIGGNAGQALKSFLASNPDRPVTMDPTLSPVDTPFDTMADFSSRGPSIGNFEIKPELVAVGSDIYTATQKYDPNSGMYDPSGYGAFSGTSFSAPMVAGAAALVRQSKATLDPAHLTAAIKSAVVNTASTEIQSLSQTAGVKAVGAGKLNTVEAVRTMVSVDPPTLSFGVVNPGFLPLSRTLRFRNVSGGLVQLQLSVVPRNADPNAQLVVNPNNIPLSAGQWTDVTVRLSGQQPLPGSYEGVITVQGAQTNLRVPYLYLVGDGLPHNIFPVLGDGFEGIVSGRIPGGFIGFKLIDQYGVPVQGISTTFHPPPGGFIEEADGQTDVYGIAAALVFLGSQLGEQKFTADAGALTVEFNGIGRLRPAINTNGVENAGSGEPATSGRPVAPGSYIAIKGQALSPTTRAFSTLYLPLSLANVSVSFDIPTAEISLPGRIHFVSDRQINVQIPWELEGYNSVKIKVSIGDISSAVFNLPLGRNSPGFFEVPLGSGIPAALDEEYKIVGATNPVQRGAWVSLYCNGLGPVDNRPASGEATQSPPPLARTLDPVTVTIGGRAVTPGFSGLTPTAIGLYQVNVKVPEDISPGLQPLVLTVNGVAAKTVSLPVK